MTSGKRGPKIFTTFRPAIYERIAAYADAGGMSDQDAVRELVEMGISVSPSDAAVLAARQRAYDDARRFVTTLLMAKLKELSRDVEGQLGLTIWREGQQ